MPKCEGRPSGPCPFGKNDRSVHLSQGDLMLCDQCESFRFPDVMNARAKNAKSANKRPVSASHVNSPSASSTGCSSNVNQRSSNHVILNELLTYVGHYRNCSSRDAILRVAGWFFSPTEVSAAKKCLVDELGELVHGTSAVTERRSTTTRPAHEAELEDIVSAFDHIDANNNLNRITFAAVNLSRVPSYGPEEVNICSISDKQIQMSKTVEQLSHTLDALRSEPMKVSPDDIRDDVKACLKSIEKVEVSVAATQNKIDDIGKMSMQLQKMIGSMQHSTTTTVRGAGDVDRSCNIIIYGINESRDPSVWHNTVLRSLESAAGRAVDITDAVRLGRFNTLKHRPILVKLKSVWDKRLVLSRTHSLRDTDEFKCIFIKADEPPEVRKQKTLDRLKRTAETNGQTVTISEDGVLIVDNISIFCPIRGFVNRRTAATQGNQHG